MKPRKKKKKILCFIIVALHDCQHIDKIFCSVTNATAWMKKEAAATRRQESSQDVNLVTRAVSSAKVCLCVCCVTLCLLVCLIVVFFC